MRKSWHIFSTDIRKLLVNWVACVIIGGLIILPSLYAWFNIKASWDPYAQTDQIPVGIVNEDVGATVRDDDIHVGDQLVDTLKKNNSFEWHFVNEENAMDRLEYGDYYATVIIPKDFSEKLATVISDHPEKAHVKYFVNEKINAIAPKITDKGASVIVEQISSEFISTVNGIIFDIFNQIGIELEKDLPDIQNFEKYVFTLEDKLPDIHHMLEDTSKDASSAMNLIAKAEKAVPEVKKGVRDGLKIVRDAQDYLNVSQKKLDELAPLVKEDVRNVQDLSQRVNEFLSSIDESNVDLTPGKELVASLDKRLAETIETIDTIVANLSNVQETPGESAVPPVKNELGDTIDTKLNEIMEHLNEISQQLKTQEKGGNDAALPGEDIGQPEDSNKQLHDVVNVIDQLLGDMKGEGTEQGNNANIADAVQKLETLRTGLQQLRDQAAEITTFLNDKEVEAKENFALIQDLAKKTSNRLDTFVNEFDEKIEPRIKTTMVNAKDLLANTEKMLTNIDKIMPQVESLLASTSGKIVKGNEMLKKALGGYPYVNQKVQEIADRIRTLGEQADIHEIIQMLRNNPEAERGFFKEPVVLDANKVFPIKNYGTGMTPFYTVLAIWVGGLLLISLLSTDVHAREAFTGRVMYFGRLFTFMTIAILQTLIVTIGDMIIVGVTVHDPLWFVIFGIFISIVFILIIYTLVSVFGDVGKALAIVLLVLQIAGSGGTYPVVLLPKFFQAINPFLPFTYAVGLMREAVGGIVWEKALHDMMFLAVIGIAVVLFGVFLKEPINKHSRKLKAKSEESGLFH
ncbi:YhgE/Pip family protein [Virgibacillus soli]|uniref:YhgE/Pip family protein n=1 Tax=Paracerasibacillus soli TaxID=480284 RepID=UPI0035ECFB49